MEARPALGQDLWDDKGPHERLGTDRLRRLRQEMMLGADSFSHHCFCFISQELCLGSVASQANRSSLLGNVPLKGSGRRVGVSPKSQTCAGCSRLIRAQILPLFPGSERGEQTLRAIYLSTIPLLPPRQQNPLWASRPPSPALATARRCHTPPQDWLREMHVT